MAEERPGCAGARRAYGGFGGPVEAPHVLRGRERIALSRGTTAAPGRPERRGVWGAPGAPHVLRGRERIALSRGTTAAPGRPERRGVWGAPGAPHVLSPAASRRGSGGARRR